MQVIVAKPIHLNVIICRRLHLDQVGRALRLLRVLRHIHHCKSFLLPQRALQMLCNQKEDEICRRERWITRVRMVPSWMRSQRSPATNVGLLVSGSRLRGREVSAGLLWLTKYIPSASSLRFLHP